MVSGIHGSPSEIDANLKRVEPSVRNTVQLDTNGFQEDTVLQSRGETAAVVVHIEKSLSPGERLPAPDRTAPDRPAAVQSSEVKFVEEATHPAVAKAALDANLIALDRAMETDKSIIDLMI